MIHVDRDRVAEPAVLDWSEVRSIRESAEKFFAVEERYRKQTRFDFSMAFGHVELAEALSKLFHRKCAYCEQPMDYERTKGFLDRFRPARGAIGLDGLVAADHYWWLAFNWDNMLGACSRCNRAKGSRFPVEGIRADSKAEGQLLDAERPLLLDPCADLPEEHLVFGSDGHVSGLTRRGQVTIEVLALNGEDLVRQRAEESRRFEVERAAAKSDRDFASLTADHRSFAALRRCLARAHEAGGMHQRTIESQAKHEQQQFDAERRDFRIGGEPDQVARERGRTRYIERISLRNIGIHARLNLEVKAEGEDGAPWLVLLGENGAGKSTILKAVALLLAGPTQWTRLGPLATALLPMRKGAGEIAVLFTDGEWVKLLIDASAQRVESSFNDPKYRVIGFGATRLLPTPKHRPPVEPPHARLANLFDPFCPLPDAIAWLLTLDELQLERAGTAIKMLLNLPDAAQIRAYHDRVELVERRLGQDIRILSDGYQTVIGVACAVMAGLVGPDQPVETAEGIVLIDELGNHLHPAWRMRVVRGLKRAFPRVQFIATTHEPLCLRGLADGEIAVLRRTGPRMTMLVKDPPPISGMLVDQILSSPHFGLGSTLDPEIADLLDEYYRLLARGERTAPESQRLQDLELLVRRLRPIGNSPSEQILLRTIDEHLALAKRDHRALDPGALPPDLMAELQAVLASAK